LDETLTTNVIIVTNIVLSMLLAHVQIINFMTEYNTLRVYIFTNMTFLLTLIKKKKTRVRLIVVKFTLIVLRVDILLICVIGNLGFL